MFLVRGFRQCLRRMCCRGGKATEIDLIWMEPSQHCNNLQQKPELSTRDVEVNNNNSKIIKTPNIPISISNVQLPQPVQSTLIHCQKDKDKDKEFKKQMSQGGLSPYHDKYQYYVDADGFNYPRDDPTLLRRFRDLARQYDDAQFIMHDKDFPPKKNRSSSQLSIYRLYQLFLFSIFLLYFMNLNLLLLFIPNSYYIMPIS